MPERDQRADIKGIDKADFVPKPMIATSSANFVPKTMVTRSSAHMPKTPTTSTGSSPELEVSIPHINPELTKPSPVLGDVDHTQDQEERPICIPKELLSTLKFVEEDLKPRPKPQYDGCYRMPLPGDGDEDFSTVLEFDKEESDLFVRKGNDDVGETSSRSEHEDSASAFHAERPSEETIANLSTEQKRQVCYTYLEDNDYNNIYRLGNHSVATRLGTIAVDQRWRSFFLTNQRNLHIYRRLKS